MRADVVFVAAYAAVLLALSGLLHRLGRARTDAWTSRALAGHRRTLAEPVAGDAAADWPHMEVPRLHTGMALVAAAAATVLSTAELLRHHRPAEAVVLGVVVLLCLAVVLRLATRLRARPPGSRGQHQASTTSGRESFSVGQGQGIQLNGSCAAARVAGRGPTQGRGAVAGCPRLASSRWWR